MFMLKVMFFAMDPYKISVRSVKSRYLFLSVCLFMQNLFFLKAENVVFQTFFCRKCSMLFESVLETCQYRNMSVFKNQDGRRFFLNFSNLFYLKVGNLVF